MFQRTLQLPEKQSFFLFGARGTGKTTLLHTRSSNQKVHFIDLLNLDQEDRFIRDPELLARILDELEPACQKVIIDEIQRAPRLLDVIHRMSEELKRRGRPMQFMMTGSSARKLKRGAANLLAGRAFVYHLFPLTVAELRETFNLQHALEYGTLPEIANLESAEMKIRYLEAYSRTYLKEEVWNEQIIRKLEPFSQFLEVAAQMNGKVLNYSKIARDIGTDVKSVQSYFRILEDTLLGFLIPAYHRSIRKRQLKNPKFYFFDLGVKRSLERTLSVPLLPQTSAFGDAFEHFVLLEMIRLNEYKKRDYRFFYLQTHDGAEIDLVIERPARPVALAEIKSSDRVDPLMIRHLRKFSKEFSESECYCLSRDPIPQKFGPIQALSWQDGIKAIGL